MSELPPGEPFELPLTVEPTDIDALGHVNNVVYVRWIQDAAVAHWRTLATPAQQQALIWVVVRHEVDYKSPAFAGDEVMARTWVGVASRRTFERHTEIVRRGDHRVLVRARTLWCPLDPHSSRPVEVDDDVRRRFSVPSADGASHA